MNVEVVDGRNKPLEKGTWYFVLGSFISPGSKVYRYLGRTQDGGLLVRNADKPEGVEIELQSLIRRQAEEESIEGGYHRDLLMRNIEAGGIVRLYVDRLSTEGVRNYANGLKTAAEWYLERLEE